MKKYVKNNGIIANKVKQSGGIAAPYGLAMTSKKELSSLGLTRGSITPSLSSLPAGRGSRAYKALFSSWIFGQSPKMTQRLAQSGSIMLEVVAVLALMGVMGAMLFRQIYQRNQELHNIQMASEIRTVKEAFSAYIQANRSQVLGTCDAPGDDNMVEECTVDGDTYEAVANYLPDGWFSDANDLRNAYNLTIWNYKNTDTNRQVIYGIVVPTAATLPTTGWNFKRAARVALLIGADGGAYDPTITKCSYDSSKDCLAGALGSWEIETTGLELPNGTLPTYVATTGIDVFSPEYEAPEGAVGLLKDWTLALNRLHAYNYFSVGNSIGGAGCYAIQVDDDAPTKRKYDTGSNVVVSDSVTTELTNNCKPLFWVGGQAGGVASSNGNVYVATDLKIGDIEGNAHNEALTLTKEGVIKQKDGLIIDADGRIIAKETVSADIGDLKSGEHFVVDPAYTSTMNDIRLTSRGGARLSDILPNYILKEAVLQKANSVVGGSNKGVISLNVDKPTCPNGYRPTLMIIPLSVGDGIPQQSANVDDLSGTASGSGTGTVSGANANFKLNNATVNLTAGTLTIQGRKLLIKVGTPGPNDGATPEFNISGDIDTTGSWRVHIGYSGLNPGTTSNPNIDTSFGPFRVTWIQQTYCVWAPSLYDGTANKNKCIAAGYVYNDSTNKCTTTHAVDTDDLASVVGAERSEKSCKEAGFTWVSTSGNAHCQYTNPTAAVINGYSSGIVKEKACKNAGHTWNGTTCSDS